MKSQKYAEIPLYLNYWKNLKTKAENNVEKDPMKIVGEKTKYRKLQKHIINSD